MMSRPPAEVLLEQLLRLGQLGLHAPRVLGLGLPGDAAQVSVGLGVRLDVEALGGELAQILPRQRIASGPDLVRVDEEGRGEAQLLQHGIGVLLERPVPVVEGEHHRPLRKLAPEPGELDELGAG